MRGRGRAGRPCSTGLMNLPPASRMVPRFANPALTAYLQAMPKNIELPPRVAQAFVRDMRAFFKAKNQLKQDEIASRQLHALWPFSDHGARNFGR
jgi:hypothetical protein